VLRALFGTILLLTLGAGPGAARAGGEAARASAPPYRPDNFWEWVSNPYGAEVQTVLQKVAEIRSSIAHLAGSSDVEHYETIRDRGLRDALGMLAYALRLEPDNTELQLKYGSVAFDLGETALARRSLSEYLKNQVPDKIDPMAHSRLGQLEADAGNWSEAVVQLRRALASENRLAEPGAWAQTVLCLASVYMQTGRMSQAIDLLESVTGENTPSHYTESWDQQFLRFALAVAYDRDDQVTRAHEILDSLLSQMAQGRGVVFLGLLSNQGYGNAIPMSFTPVFDQHYFTALLYEAADHLVEARAEWNAYARLGDRAPYRQRARAHIAAIDDLLGKRLAHPTAPARRQP